MALDEIIALTRRESRVIALVTLLATASALALSLALPKTYTSESAVLVGSLTETSSDRLEAFERQAQTYAEVAVSPAMLQSVIDDLGLPDDTDALRQRLQVRSTGQAIVEVRADAATPSSASDLAAAMATRIAALGESADGTSIATVFQPATVPTGPGSPSILINVAVGALVGTMVAVGLVLIRGRRRSSSPAVG